MLRCEQGSAVLAALFTRSSDVQKDEDEADENHESDDGAVGNRHVLDKSRQVLNKFKFVGLYALFIKFSVLGRMRNGSTAH